ncbi:hypothetical protein GCM10022296_16620 [Secundilactobacillus similis DSM 23365 = JCM 2765]
MIVPAIPADATMIALTLVNFDMLNPPVSYADVFYLKSINLCPYLKIAYSFINIPL